VTRDLWKLIFKEALKEAETAHLVSHPLGVDLRSVIMTFKPLWILMRKPIRRFESQVQNGNVGYVLERPMVRLGHHIGSSGVRGHDVDRMHAGKPEVSSEPQS
jgi:hypothetical protein